MPIDPSVDFVIVMIGLAVGVDYSLFYLRREREERAAGHSPPDSLEIAAATSGRAVLISGVTVLVAMAGMFISGIAYFTSFAIGTMIVVAFAMFASLTVLPAILSWLGDRVEKGRIPFVGRRRRAAGESRFWGALVDRVTRRPWLSITSTIQRPALPAARALRAAAALLDEAGLPWETDRQCWLRTGQRSADGDGQQRLGSAAAAHPPAGAGHAQAPACRTAAASCPGGLPNRDR